MLDLFANDETLGLPIIECDWDNPTCDNGWNSQWQPYQAPPFYGYNGGNGTVNSTPGTMNQTAATSNTSATQTATNTPPLGQPPTTQTQIVAGVDNKTLLLIGAAVGLIAIAK